MVTTNYMQKILKYLLSFLTEKKPTNIYSGIGMSEHLTGSLPKQFTLSQQISDSVYIHTL